MPFARAPQIVTASQGWTERAIHDTVAAIAAEAKFTRAPRQSLLGRLFRYLWERLGDFIAWLHGRGDARILLFGVGALVIIVIVARVLVERQMAEARRLRAGRSRFGSSTSDDLWSAAQEQAAAGRFDDACHSTYAAVLDDLAREGVVKLHASKTSGDYARELQRRGHPRAAEYRVFARTFDRVAFGTDEITADEYARVRDAALAVFQRQAAA